jgi:excisionase family DNA binding protein
MVEPKKPSRELVCEHFCECSCEKCCELIGAPLRDDSAPLRLWRSPDDIANESAPRHAIEGADVHHGLDDMSTEKLPETHQHGDEQPHSSDDSDQYGRGRIRPLEHRPSPLPLVLSVPQAAAMLGISKDLAYDLIARGELPSLHFGRRVVVPTKPLLNLLNGAGVANTPERSA